MLIENFKLGLTLMRMEAQQSFEKNFYRGAWVAQ